MHALRVANGLQLDFTPGAGGASDAFLAVDTNGAVVQFASIAVNRLAAQTASRVTVFDGSGFLTPSSITTTKLGYLSNVTSDIQAQLNSKQGTITLAANSIVVTDGLGALVAPGSPTAIETSYLGGVTSALQTQLNNKQATITGAASTAVSADFTPSVAVFSNGAGKLATVNAFTSAIANYLVNISSDVQAQINSKLTVVLTSPVSGQTISYNGTNWINTNSTALPSGGSTHQILRKASGTDFDTEWHTLVLADIGDVSATSAEVNILSGATLSTTELNYVIGVTSSIQTQINNRVINNLALNAMWVGDAGNHAVQLITGADGYILTSVGGVPTWQPATPPGNVSGVAPSVDNAIARWNGTGANSIQNSGVIIDDSNNVSGVASLTLTTGAGIRTNTSAGNTVLFQAYDVDGAAYTTFATLTANNTPTFDLATSVTIGTAYIYRVGGTVVALADGGTGASLTDPGANRLWGWDDTDNAIKFITIGTNLSYDHATHTLSATGGGGSGDVSGPVSSTDNAIVRFDSTTGKIIQNSVGILDDTGNLSGIANVTLTTGSALRTSTSAGNTLLLQAYDVDGTSYTTFGTLTANNTPTFDLSSAVTIGTAYIYRVGGTDVALADGGTGASLADPNADRIFFWDDSAGSTAFLVPGNTLLITTTTIDVVLGGSANEIQMNNGGQFGGTGLFSASSGKITTGEWNGTVIGVAYGGTGISSYTIGDLIYASGATTLAQLADVATGNALISGGVATAMSWGKITSAHVDSTVLTTSTGWKLASGGTLTGANTIVASASNTFQMKFDNITISNTAGIGIWLRNTTAATNPVPQQNSPNLSFEAHGLKTTGNVDQNHTWQMYVIPTSGSTNSTSRLTVTSSVDGLTATGGLSFINNGPTISSYPNGVNWTGGLALDGSIVPSANTFSVASIGFTLTQAAVATSSYATGMLFNITTIGNATSGTQNAFLWQTGGFTPASGTATYNFMKFTMTVNQSGATTSTINQLNLAPTYTAANNVRGVYYNPTVTTISGNHYAWESTAGTMLIGGGGNFQITTGDILLGLSTDTGTARNIVANGTNSTVDLTFKNKGSGALFNFITTSGAAILKPTGGATTFTIYSSTLTLAYDVTYGGFAIANEVNASSRFTLSPGGLIGISTRIQGSSPTAGTSAGGDVILEPGRGFGGGADGSVKIATAGTDKLSFYGVATIVQPTTGIASATFVANAGTGVNDASTFDGYTLKQVVKAMRNIGLLA